MFQRSVALVPVARVCCGALRDPLRVHSRNIWDMVRAADSRSIIRELNREMERMERNFFRGFPPFNFARWVPIAGEETAPKSYKVNIDVDGYKCDDIKISLKDNVMKIEGKMDRTAEDGSKLQQAFVREFTIPANVDLSSLKSFVSNDGILSIEASLLKNEQDPKAIPIEREGEAIKSKM